jgi:isopentenyl-diphosphate delta-isomerase
MFLVGADNLEELKNSSLIIKGETREWLEARGIDVKKYARR